MKFRHKLIGAFLILTVLFVGYFYYLDQSHTLKEQIRQTSREIRILSNQNNHYYQLYTQQKLLARNYQMSDILFVHIPDEDVVSITLEARAWANTEEPRRPLSTLLFSR